MQKRSSFALAAATAVLIAACSGGGATPAPTSAPPPAAPQSAAAPTPPAEPTATAAATAAATGTPEATPTAAESASAEPPSAPPSSTGGEWKIGVVTDVGTVDDKNFNQYSFEGAKLGAQDINAAEPDVVVPKDNSEYATNIQNFIDTGHNLIVTVGFNLNTDTLVAAKANPDVWFIGVDQSACVDETGAPDTTFTCAGNAQELLPNFVGLQYQEDQAGYLAGIVAASISENGNVAAIGGINSVPAVVRYIQGFELGAKSVNPDITFNKGYVSTSDFGVAFNNPGEGKNYADQFIQTNSPDVIFQVAGKTGNGILEAACKAGLMGIGVDVDQWLSLSADTDPTYNCIVTSAEKHLSSSVQATIGQIAAGETLETGQFGALSFNATNDGIGVSEEHDGKGLITADIQTALDTALAGMKDGSLVTCPETCGTEQ
jgi:basic membrane protein A